MPCANCGKDLKPGAGFCTACGTVAAASRPPAPGAGIPPPPQPQPPRDRIPTPPQSHPKANPQQLVPAPQAGVPTPPPSAETEDNLWAQYQAPLDETAAPVPPPQPRIDVRNLSPRVKTAAALAAVAIIATAAFFIRKANQPPAQSLSGVYSNSSYNFSVTFPPAGWNLMLPDPEKPEENTLLFQRGDLSNPDAAMKVFYTELPATASQAIPAAFLKMLEKGFVSSAEKIIAGEGYVYTHRAFSPYAINGSGGVFLEGDGKRGDDLPRIMFFNAMHGRRSFYILFILRGKDKDALRAEAFKIIDSLKFL